MTTVIAAFVKAVESNDPVPIQVIFYERKYITHEI